MVKHFTFYNLLHVEITFTDQPLPTLAQATDRESTHPQHNLQSHLLFLEMEVITCMYGCSWLSWSNSVAVLLFDANLGIFFFFFPRPFRFGFVLHTSPLLGPVTQKIYRSLLVSLQIWFFFFYFFYFYYYYFLTLK